MTEMIIKRKSDQEIIMNLVSRVTILEAQASKDYERATELREALKRTLTTLYGHYIGVADVDFILKAIDWEREAEKT